MTHEEANHILSLGPAASSAEVRKAYLAKIKVHKPESDPEMFSEVREAYELLTATAALQERHARRSQAEAGVVVDGESPLADGTDASSSDADVTSPPAPQTDAYPEPTREPAAPDASTLMAEAFKALDAKDSQRAVAITETVLGGSEGPLPPPIAQAILFLVLGLYEAQAANDAAALAQELHDRLAAFSDEISCFSGDSAVVWRATRELAYLGALPGGFAAAVAGTLRDDRFHDLPLARKELQRLGALREREAQDLIRAHAPTVGALIGIAGRDQQKQSGSIPRWAWPLIVMAMIGIGRLSRQLKDFDHSFTEQATTEFNAVWSRGTPRNVANPLASADGGVPGPMFATLCRERPALHVCAVARVLGQKSSMECSEMSIDLAALQQFARDTQTYEPLSATECAQARHELDPWMRTTAGMLKDYCSR
jgi:hypothetical protein